MNVIEVRLIDDGPLKLTGASRVVDPDGAPFTGADAQTVYLCRCGHSQNKPFCDGSHAAIKFRDA